MVFHLVKEFIRLKFPVVQRMTTVEFDQHLKDAAEFHPLILDARTEEEYTISHLAGAKRIDVTSDLAKEQVLQAVSKDQPIVVYCSVGYRSAQIAQQLAQAGFSQVFNLEGGLFEWANEQRPLMHNGLPTQRVHPYNAIWGTLLARRNRVQE